MAWPWLVVLGSCLFWGDVFVRRVQINLDWLWVAIGRLRDKILGRVREAEVPETMSRLRSRKQQIEEQVEALGNLVWDEENFPNNKN